MPAGRRLVGVEAVIDKDLASALLADGPRRRRLADRHRRRRRLRRTGGRRTQRAIRRATPAELVAESEFAAGSMGPKVQAACEFVERTGGVAAIGSIGTTPALLRGDGGHARSATRPFGSARAADAPVSDDGDGSTGTEPGRRKRAATALARDAVEEVCRELGVDADVGLDAAEVERRRGQVRPQQARRGEAGAGLARVPAPVPRPDAARPGRRRDRQRRRARRSGTRPSSSSRSRCSTRFSGCNQEGKAAESVAALQKMLVIKAHVAPRGRAGRHSGRGARPRRRRLVRGGRQDPRRRPPARRGDARDRGGRADGREHAGRRRPSTPSRARRSRSATGSTWPT